MRLRLRRRSAGELKVHDRFGTSTVTLDGFTYDIARTRRETYAHPGALPDVEPAPLAEDLNRRDFTVNAIALALAGDRAGELTSAPRRARRSRRAPAARSPRPQLHRRPDAPAQAGALRHSSWVRDRAAHPRARRRRDLGRSARHGQRTAGRRGATAARARAGSRRGARSGLRDLGLDAAIHPGFGLDDEDLARRALALLPADGRPRPAGAGGSRTRRTGAGADRPARRARVRGRRPRRDRGRRHSRRRGRAARLRLRARRRRSPPRWAGRRLELVALAGALGAEPQAREWLERAAPRPPGDRRTRSARRRRARGTGDRARTAGGARREARSAGRPGASRSSPRPLRAAGERR